MNNTEKLLSISLEAYDDKFKEVQELMYKLQWAKTQSYGNSCFKRSLVGIYHNVARKTDRLDNLNAQNPAVWENPDSVGGEAVLDTIADASVYMTKFMTAYAFSHPKLYEAWKNFVLQLCAETKNACTQYKDPI